MWLFSLVWTESQLKKSITLHFFDFQKLMDYLHLFPICFIFGYDSFVHLSAIQFKWNMLWFEYICKKEINYENIHPELRLKNQLFTVSLFDSFLKRETFLIYDCHAKNIFILIFNFSTVFIYLSFLHLLTFMLALDHENVLS